MGKSKAIQLFYAFATMKKVLYIAYYWPPAGGIGIVRNMKFIKYCRQFGWEPVVYAPLNASYPIVDASTEKDFPENVAIIRRPIFEPYSFFNKLKGKAKTEKVKDVFLNKDSSHSLSHKLGIWLRANFFIPDARAFWIKPSIQYLKEYIKQNPVDAIISYGPPHSMHIIAMELQKAFDIPWISDWQDPWSEIDYFTKFPMTKMAEQKHLRLEKEVITKADKLVMVSKNWCKDLEKLSNRTVDYIPFGYDNDDFANIPTQHNPYFTISHFGTFGVDRNPNMLWQALSELSNEIKGFAAKLKLHIAGYVAHDVLEAIRRYGLQNNLNYQEQIPKNDLFKYYVSSSVQLVLINVPDEGIPYNNKGRIPAKLFECVRSLKPILVIGPEDGDVANIVAETQTGVTCNYTDVGKMKTIIKQWYSDWEQNIPSTNPVNIEQFSYEKLTQKFTALLDEISQ